MLEIKKPSTKKLSYPSQSMCSTKIWKNGLKFWYSLEPRSVRPQSPRWPFYWLLENTNVKKGGNGNVLIRLLTRYPPCAKKKIQKNFKVLILNEIFFQNMLHIMNYALTRSRRWLYAIAWLFFSRHRIFFIHLLLHLLFSFPTNLHILFRKQ